MLNIEKLSNNNCIPHISYKNHNDDPLFVNNFLINNKQRLKPFGDYSVS